MRNNRERQAALEDEAFLAEELAALSEFTIVSEEVEWQPMNSLQMSNMDWDGHSIANKPAAKPAKPKPADFRLAEPATPARTATDDPPAVDGFFTGFGWQAPGDLSDRPEAPEASPNLPPNQKPSPRAQADSNDAFSSFNWE